MTVFMIHIVPMALLIGFSALFGLWLAPAHPEGRKRDDHLILVGNVLAALSIVWLVAFGFVEGVLPVATPGHLLATLAVLIWLGHTYAQYRISQRKLTVLPLGSVVVLLAAAIVIGLDKGRTLPENLINPRAAVHIAMSLLAVTLLLGSGVFGAGEIILHRQIKRRNFGQWFHNLPPMSDLNRLRRLTLTAGWVLITVSVASAMGSIYLIPGTRDVTISHLHPMLTLWAIITALWAADHFQWIAQQKLAAASLIVSAVMVILLVLSVVEFFGGRFA